MDIIPLKVLSHFYNIESNMALLQVQGTNNFVCTAGTFDVNTAYDMTDNILTKLAVNIVLIGCDYK